MNIFINVFKSQERFGWSDDDILMKLLPKSIGTFIWPHVKIKYYINLT